MKTLVNGRIVKEIIQEIIKKTDDKTTRDKSLIDISMKAQ